MRAPSRVTTWADSTGRSTTTQRRKTSWLRCVLQAGFQAQSANADAASENMQTAAYGAPVAVLGLIGPEAVAAAALVGGLDYAGNSYSYLTGLSKRQAGFYEFVSCGCDRWCNLSVCDCGYGDRGHGIGRKDCGHRVSRRSGRCGCVWDRGCYASKHPRMFLVDLV